MLSVKDIHNKPLISVTEGKKVGDLKDLYLDTDLTRVAAVFLGREGLFKPRITIVDRSFIQVCGVDAWLTVGSDVAAALPDGDDAPSLLLAGDLHGREITTEGGTQIGTIGDILLDGSGLVAGFQLDRIYVKGPLADKKIIPREAVLEESSPLDRIATPAASPTTAGPSRKCTNCAPSK